VPKSKIQPILFSLYSVHIPSRARAEGQQAAYGARGAGQESDVDPAARQRGPAGRHQVPQQRLVLLPSDHQEHDPVPPGRGEGQGGYMWIHIIPL